MCDRSFLSDRAHLPQTPGHGEGKPRERQEGKLKLVSYNIQYGIGRDGRFDLARIAASLEGADIMALQEVTRNFARNGGADLVCELAALLPDHFHVFGPAMDVDYGVRDAAGRPVDGRLQFGNMVLSRFAIASTRNLLLPRSRRFGRGNLQRGALEALVLSPSGPLRVYSVHLDHVSTEERERQVRHLKERVLAYPMEGGSITGAAEYGFPEPPCPEEFVLLGDFNMVRGSPEYVAMTGPADPLEGRQIVAHHPVDALLAGRLLPQDAVSWVSVDQPEKNRLIDHAFVHASMVPRIRRAWIDGQAEGSDHLPVWLEID